MSAEFATKLVADLGDDLDFGRVIVLSVSELIDGVLVIDRVGREMDQIGGIVAEQARTDEATAFSVRPKFAKTAVVASEMQLANVTALRGRAQKFVPMLLRFVRRAAGEGKLRIGKYRLDVRAFRPDAGAIPAGILGRDARFDVGVVDDHAHPGDIARGKDVVLAFNPHVVANIEPAECIRREAGSREAEVVKGRPSSGREQEFFGDDWLDWVLSFRFEHKGARSIAAQMRHLVLG